MTGRCILATSKVMREVAKLHPERYTPALWRELIYPEAWTSFTFGDIEERNKANREYSKRYRMKKIRMRKKHDSHTVSL